MKGYVRTVVLECGHDAVFNPEPNVYDLVLCRRCGDYRRVTHLLEYEPKTRRGPTTTVTGS